MNLSTADLRNYRTEFHEAWWSYRYMFQCGKPLFSNTRKNVEWTETITRQDEKELAMFGE
jgi:hypothetical protein